MQTEMTATSRNALTPEALSADASDGRPVRGKAPPIGHFSGEDPVVQSDDWLPSLEREA